MALSAEAVAEAIADLSVDGITIRDLDKTPQAITDRDCPMVYPAPDKFLVLESAQQLTLGPNALWQYTYLLKYRYVRGPVGQERGLAKTTLGRVVDYQNFITAVCANAQLIGPNMHIAPASTPDWGVLGDPSEQQFQAADLEFRVTDYTGN